MFNRYKVKLTLLREMLATNPSDPAIMDTHILDKQRKLIQEKSGVNKDLNKYLNALDISKERGDAETDAIIAKLEEIIGYEFSDEQKIMAVKGDLESLKETLKEFDLKGTTVFFWNKEKNLPMIGDHMIYGFLKASSTAICRTKSKKNATVLQSDSYTTSIINQHVRLSEQFITLSNDVLRNENGTSYFKQRSLRAMTAQGPRISLAKSEVVPAGTAIEFEIKVMNGSPLELKHLKEMFSYGEMCGLGQWRNAGNGSFIFEIVEA